MCGIAGVVRLDGQPLPSEATEQVMQMTDGMAHRGPDGQGLWQAGPVCFGHRRLSIIDLAGGSQPMCSADGRLCLTFNGEIYNFAAVRQQLTALGASFVTASDTEVILHAWRQWGPDCLGHFDGMFAFALWDASSRTLFCARDRFGKKPFFYTVQDGCLWFASELHCLTRLPGLSFTLDRQAVMRYLAYDYVPTPQTPWQEAASLQPAHFLLVADGHVQSRSWWELPAPNEADCRSEEEICQEIRASLKLSVQRRMVSDVPLGVFLSGGIDSSIVVGLMAELSPRPVRTFSIGFRESSYDESCYARLVAQTFATDHCERILSADACADSLPALVSRMDTPLADASVMPSWLLAGLAREQVSVALGGDGADELWGGYEHYIAFKTARWYTALPAVLRRGLLEPLARCLPSLSGYVNPRLAAANFLKGAAAPDWLRVQTLLTALDPDMQRELLAAPWLAGVETMLDEASLYAPTRERYEDWQSGLALPPLARAFHVYARQFLLDDILVKLDRCTMLHSLEARAPFLGHEIAELAARLPLRHKLRGFKRKYLLKKAFAGMLPPEILYRNKRGFQIPVAAWLRGRLRPLLEDMLAPDRLRADGIFDPQAVRRLMDTHFSGRVDLRKPLWNLLVFQLWRETHK